MTIKIFCFSKRVIVYHEVPKNTFPNLETTYQWKLDKKPEKIFRRVK